MKTGKYFLDNQKRVENLTDADWKVALAKCKFHLRWKLKQKTLSGAHSASRLGADPIDYYLGVSYEKLLSGEWEWRQEYSLFEQLVRIIDSTISKEIEKVGTKKNESVKITYKEDMDLFYEENDESDVKTQKVFDEQLREVERAAEGDEQLEFIISALKEGKKRSEIACLMDIQPRQFDKLREKLIRRLKNSKLKADYEG